MSYPYVSDVVNQLFGPSGNCRFHMPGIILFLGYCSYRPVASFGEWLKQCRTTWGLSQVALSQRLKFDESTIARWDVVRIGRSRETSGG